MEQKELNNLVDLAVGGDGLALEALLSGVSDLVFNLSLRMLGTVPDAEDASQEVMIRILTNLSSFQKKSSFTTWVYRLTINYLMNYKKSMFSHQPLDFEFYGNDIKYAAVDEVEVLLDDMTRKVMEEELKMSCTNVMLQCLDPESRCIFVLGTMFKVDSRTAGELLDMSPENYRQKLSRIRKKVGDFLDVHCGLTKTGCCSCGRRVNYAVSQRRISPDRPDFTKLRPVDQETMVKYKDEMEKLDEMSLIFEELPDYKSPVTARRVMEMVLKSSSMNHVRNLEEASHE